MSSGAQVIGSGVVQVKADDSQFKDALNKLPAQAQSRIDLTMRAIQDRIAKTRFDLVLETDPGKIRKLEGALDLLERKLNQTKLNAIAMGASIDAAAQRSADSAAKAAQRKADAVVAASKREMDAQQAALARIQATGVAISRQGAQAAAGIGKTAQAAEEGGSRAANALYQVGALIDDAQYGFRGVLNNIPQIAIALGQPGLAGAAAIAATAMYQLYIHSDDLLKLFGLNKVKSAAEQMKELADQTSRSATEQERLNKAKRQESTVESHMGLRSESEEQASREIRGAIGEAGVNRVKQGLKTSGLAQADAAERSRIENEIEGIEDKINLAGTVGGELARKSAELYYKKQLEDLRREAKNLEDRAVEQFLADVENNVNGRREQLAQYAAAHPEQFGTARLTREELEQRTQEEMARNPRLTEQQARSAVLRREQERQGTAFAASLVVTSPEAIEAKKKDEADRKRTEEETKDKDKAAKDAADSEAKFRQIEADSMNKAGEEFQRNQEKEANRFSGAMARGAIGRRLLENPGANVANDIKAQLMASGKSSAEAGMLSPIVAEQIKKDLEQRVIDYIARHPGSSKESAGLAIAAEEKAKEDRKAEQADERVMAAQERVDQARQRLADVRRGPGASFSGLTEFAKSTQVGALNQADRQKELIEATKAATKAEQELATAIKQRKEAIAQAAP